MQISKRLTALALLVTEGSRLADVGTDHGYVPIYLIRENRIPRAIAMDVRKGPLARAEEHIRAFGLSDRIETRLSDGLDALEAGEADTILMAGMGGGLIRRILKRGLAKAGSAGELILQPQSEPQLVRRFLWEQGYSICSEHMVCEDGKYYPFWKARPGSAGEEEEPTEEELYFGKVSLQRNPEVLLAFLERNMELQQEIRRRLQKSQSGKSRQRQEEVTAAEERLKRCRDRLLGREQEERICD